MPLAAAPEGFKSGLVDTTPDMAAKAVENGATNRTEKPKAIEKYAGDMLHGKWDPYNGETIKFNKEGRLVDGLQRMSALKLAGETNPDIEIPFLVVNNVSDDAQLTTDAGVGRSFADWLKIDKGVAMPTVVGAVIHRMYLWDETGMRAGKIQQPTSYSDQLEYYLTHEDEDRKSVV